MAVDKDGIQNLAWNIQSDKPNGKESIIFS